MIKKIFYCLIVISLSLAACSAAKTESEMPASEPLAAEYDRVSEESANSVFSRGSIPTTNRMVIRDVQIGLAVDDPEASASRIQAMAESMGGYVAELNMRQVTLANGLKVPQGHITVRIPVERLNEAIDKIKAETYQPVLNENIDSQDVTGEYIDLSSRLRNLESAEEQLQKIMDEAIKTEDVLNVYSQLVSTREQIELIKGQMQYYEQAASLSSIQVMLYTNEAVQPLSIGSWEPKGVAKDAIQTLINTVKWLVNAGIWIVLYILPTAIMIFAPLGLIFWGVRRIYKKAKQGKVPPPPEEAS